MTIGWTGTTRVTEEVAGPAEIADEVMGAMTVLNTIIAANMETCMLSEGVKFLKEGDVGGRPDVHISLLDIGISSLRRHGCTIIYVSVYDYLLHRLE